VVVRGAVVRGAVGRCVRVGCVAPSCAGGVQDARAVIRPGVPRRLSAALTVDDRHDEHGRHGVVAAPLRGVDDHVALDDAAAGPEAAALQGGLGGSDAAEEADDEVPRGDAHVSSDGLWGFG